VKSRSDSGSWSHVGVRVPQPLKKQLEALAEAENVSISDLVRRSLAMQLAGGPARWLELEQAQLERIANESGGAGERTPPEVRRYGEWMRALPAEGRILLHAVGEVATFEESRLLEEIDLLEGSPVPIWCVSLDEPVPTASSEDTQIDSIRSSGKVVACNPACRQQHGKSYCKDGSRRGVLPAPILDEDVLREFVRDGYRLQGRLVTCADHLNGRPGHHVEDQIPVVLHLLGQKQEDRLVRIWGIEFEATDLGAQARYELNAPSEGRHTGSPPGASPPDESRPGGGPP
jgi:hypothetical protein